MSGGDVSGPAFVADEARSDGEEQRRPTWITPSAAAARDALQSLATRLGVVIEELRVPGAEDRVTVWATRRVHAPGLWPLLTPSERRRAERFRRDEDVDRYVAGRALLRLVAQARPGGAGTSVEIDTTRLGALRVQVDGVAEAFSVAHSGDWAVVAHGPSGVVGVDVERLRPPAGDHVLEFALTPRERADLGQWAASPTAIHELASLGFTRAWARKEAVAKAWGAGWGAPMDRVDVGVSPFPSHRPVRALGDAPDLWVVDFDVDPAHVAAVAYARIARRPRAAAVPEATRP